MSREVKRGKQDVGSDAAEKVVLAVKASKEIPKTALVWALSHVFQPGHCITLLVVVPSQSSAVEAETEIGVNNEFINCEETVGTAEGGEIDLKDDAAYLPR